MTLKNDPIGAAINAFLITKEESYITVASDLCDDDVIPASHFFRTFETMPTLERLALDQCTGKILDVGAGAGCHSRYLLEKGLSVHAIDISAGAVAHLRACGITAEQKTIFDLKDPAYDTILLLMNGIGLAGSMDQLPVYLQQLKKLLSPGGKILCDSTDIAYLFAEEDGSFLLNLNDRYYGEMQFNMHYGDQETGWFSWLYIDFDNLSEQASRQGLTCTLIAEGENHHYLVCLQPA